MVTTNPVIGQQSAGDFAASVRMITPDEAATIIETSKYVHQRHVLKAHVSMLAEEMRAGRFISGTAIRIAFVDGAALLIDGQHRLHAVVESQIPQVFTVVEEDAKDLDCVGWTYGSLDINRRRTPADLYKPIGLVETLSLSSTSINQMSAAIKMLDMGLMRQSNHSALSKAQMVDTITMYAPHMRRFIESVPGKNLHMDRSFRRSYVVALALLTFRYTEPGQGPKATRTVVDFWRGVAYDDGLSSNDPRKVANRHLLTTSLSSPSNTLDSDRVTTAVKGARVMAACFNNYMRGRMLKNMPRTNDTEHVSIVGVPDDCAEWLKS
jgi:hypothetical protein